MNIIRYKHLITSNILAAFYQTLTNYVYYSKYKFILTILFKAIMYY